MLCLNFKEAFARINPCSTTDSSTVCILNSENYTTENPGKPWPVQVNITMSIKDLTEVDYDHSSLTLSFKINLEWIDKNIINNKTTDGKWFMLETTDLKHIWSPEIYFSNALDIAELGSSGKSGSTQMLWYRHPNILYYSQVLKATFKCDLDHEEYPFGNYQCRFQMRSWAGGNTKVQFNNPVIYDALDPDQKILQIVERFVDDKFLISKLNSYIISGSIRNQNMIFL